MSVTARAYVHSLQTQTERLVTLYNSLMQTLCGFSVHRNPQNVRLIRQDNFSMPFQKPNLKIQFSTNQK
jgi:hypothetical protein